MAMEEENIPAQVFYNPLQVTRGWEEYLELEVAKSNLNQNLHNRSILLIEMYSKSEPFDAWIPYLAANIFNLYVCKEKVDHENERTIDLITLSCLSIAWKSREKDFYIRMLKAKYKKLHTITQNMCLDMEFQILDALGSTPRSLRILTPIIFSHYFASIVKMNYSPHEHDALFCEIIVQCQSEYWVAKLRPSLIAALGALVISTLFSLKVFNKFYKALEKNQFITEDEFICYFPEMLKLFQKLKIDKEHRQVFDFPIKWKNNIKCASRFLIFTNMRIIEQPKLEVKLENCKKKK
ncbi:uncharacterized protein LOC115713088 [Cannabis sativa]|uniref:uncharacterized protein LOC115713088 n=1 Tax=Cannabis sativa TaxID=3483 RepID=UPI0029CA4FB9|nr:uncharacterized protein LOC115713088 [Cannabis sativa]